MVSEETRRQGQRNLQSLNAGTEINEGDNAILDINGDYKAFVTVKKEG